jgi:acyl dehydratase
VTDETTIREVEGDPGGLSLMLKAALPTVPVVSSLPGVRKSGGDLPDLALTRHDVEVDPGHVAAYSAVCGFPLRQTLPLTYPHILAFGLHMAILTDRDFPFPAMGTVHLENAITQHRPISPSERLQVTARPHGLRSHPKGRVFDILTEVHSAGELVWEETSTFIRRGKGDPDATDTGLRMDPVESNGIEWRLGGDLGRRYAAVSGDHNPIHLYALTAKALGFPRQIAHGMWSKARCVAMLEPRLPDAVRVEVAFKKPVHLPATVPFGSSPAGSGRRGDWEFSLTRPKDGAPHLVGRTTGL